MCHNVSCYISFCLANSCQHRIIITNVIYFVFIGFDTFKEELGSSRDASLRRETSLNGTYDEQDIMKVLFDLWMIGFLIFKYLMRCGRELLKQLTPLSKFLNLEIWKMQHPLHFKAISVGSEML